MKALRLTKLDGNSISVANKLVISFGKGIDESGDMRASHLYVPLLPKA
jgi:hypothetical protein